uniref:hypothetical protein n=1 Tax=Lachnospira sp. TaxID=2049031 RepID=UPI004028D5C8
NLYRWYECDAQGYSDMIKITDFQKFALTKNIDILYEEDAVIMGRSLNRAVYDENGSLRAILAGNLMVVRRNGKNYESICDDKCKCAKQTYIVENVDMCYHVRKQ